jgi:hypothetical protein
MPSVSGLAEYALVAVIVISGLLLLWKRRCEAFVRKQRNELRQQLLDEQRRELQERTKKAAEFRRTALPRNNQIASERAEKRNHGDASSEPHVGRTLAKRATIYPTSGSTDLKKPAAHAEDAAPAVPTHECAELEGEHGACRDNKRLSIVKSTGVLSSLSMFQQDDVSTEHPL